MGWWHMPAVPEAGRLLVQSQPGMKIINSKPAYWDPVSKDKITLISSLNKQFHILCPAEAHQSQKGC